jgi:CRISPR/Cas system-associated endoribonuclease Cas2
VLFESFTGSLIESNLQSILIYPITPAQAQKRETLAHQKEQLLNEVMGGGKK